MALGIVAWSAPLFLGATALGLLAVWGSTRPEVRVVERAAERGRRVA